MPFIESFVLWTVGPPVVIRGVRYLVQGMNVLADRVLRICDVPEAEIDQYEQREDITAAQADMYREYYRNRREAEERGEFFGC